jgi:hypothetical protein
MCLLTIFEKSMNRSLIARKRKSESLFAFNPERLAKHHHWWIIRLDLRCLSQSNFDRFVIGLFDSHSMGCSAQLSHQQMA